MKKLIVFMPSFKAGGAQRVLSIIMNNMIKEGHDVVLVLIKKDSPIEYILESNIKIIRNNNFSRFKFINFLFEIYFMRDIMKKNLNSNCLSFITMYNLYTIIASVGLSNNIIVSERNDPSKSLEKKSIVLHFLRNYLYTKASYVVFQTNDALNYFKRIKGIKSCVIPNPISDNLPIKKRYDDSVNFVAIARLEKQKNYPLLLKAMDCVIEKYPNVKLFIYGKGSEENKLKKYCQKLKNSKNIIFKGFTTNISEVLIDAYAFISSSDYEGISNSMLEALAIGVPCVCTDCPSGGARMFIKDHENGLLIPIKNEKALINALIELLENPNDRIKYGINSLYVREILNSYAIYKKWLNIFI